MSRICDNKVEKFAIVFNRDLIHNVQEAKEFVRIPRQCQFSRTVPIANANLEWQNFIINKSKRENTENINYEKQRSQTYRVNSSKNRFQSGQKMFLLYKAVPNKLLLKNTRNRELRVFIFLMGVSWLRRKLTKNHKPKFMITISKKQFIPRVYKQTLKQYYCAMDIYYIFW